MVIIDQQKVIRVSHVISHQEPQKVIEQVEAFKVDKTNFVEIYNTTPIMAGVNGGQANLVVITTCLCLWDSTIADYKTFQNRLELTGGKLV